MTVHTMLASETAELLQQMIRNECVNDGSTGSGHERRSVDTLTSYLDGSGLDMEVYEPAPGRASLVTKIEGSRSDAPGLMLMGHTDVVPVNADRWSRDPFGGELVAGEVWGRGAVDMLNLTASMAVALKHLAAEGFRPEGTLTYLAVADEEALGSLGAGWLAEHELSAVGADHIITESGGIPIPGPAGLRLPVLVGEKGECWCRIRIRGTAGHGSQPYRTDNALVTAAEVVRRLDSHVPATEMHDTWTRFITSMGYPDEMVEPLIDPDGFLETLEALPDGMARQFHACTHMTIAPTVITGGSKINTIPDEVELQVDVRTLPGTTTRDVLDLLDHLLGDLGDLVSVEPFSEHEATLSPVDTPLWHTLERVSEHFYAGSQIVPYLSVGATDARFFRDVGATAYGFGMFSRNLSFEDYGSMFHGDDERVDVESLGLSTELWGAVSRDLLGG
jgi:acetylornithine deacetylase/succinyl-diaminopimelate desuccinylase-like protein